MLAVPNTRSHRMSCLHARSSLVILACVFVVACIPANATFSGQESGERVYPKFNCSLCPLGPGKASSQVVNGSGQIWPYQVFKSAPFNPPQMQITTNGKPLAPGLLFITPTDFTPINATQDAAPLILSDAGQLVWNGPTGNSTNLRVASYHGKSILTFWTGFSSAGANVGHGYGNVTFLNSSYNEILTVCPKVGLVTPDNTSFPCEADLHESHVTDRNTLLVTAYNVTTADLTSVGGSEHGWVYDCLFLEIDPKDSTVLFRWSALDHVPVSATKLSLQDKGRNQSAPFDYFHINSVVDVGNAFLINSRHTWTTYLVSAKGDIIWKLNGETGGDFGPLPLNAHFVSRSKSPAACLEIRTGENANNTPLYQSPGSITPGFTVSPTPPLLSACSTTPTPSV